MLRKILSIGSAAFLVLLASSAARADSYSVNVGYADDQRPSPFFPTPWQGDANTLFYGASPNIDAGAIQIVNTSGATITFDTMTVSGFGDGSSFNLWNSATAIPAGDSLILTQTTQYNFDTSDDEGSNPLAIPEVSITIDGVQTNFFDTAQVLNTEGTDHLGANNLNESHAWRPIGTFGGQAGTVPLPSSAWASLALLGCVAVARSKKWLATGR